MKDLEIIIPTLNEGKNIEKMILSLLYNYPSVSVCIVDDGSKDNTQNLVNKFSLLNVRLIDRSNCKVKGLTASVLEGIRTTQKRYFIVMDADFQHPISAIKEMYEKTQENNLVIGVRRQTAGWSLSRKLISDLAILLGNIRLRLQGKRYKDIVSGFFGGKSDYIKIFSYGFYDKFELKGYKVLFDLLKLIPEDLNVGYVLYDFNLRTEGKSKMNKSHILYYFKSIWR